MKQKIIYCLEPHIFPIVTCWPSAELSNKRYTCVNNRCIRSKISGYKLDCGRVELGADVTPTRNRWVSNNCITRCHRQVQLVGDKLLYWEPAPREDWALRTPGWAAQQNEKEVLLKTEELGVNMFQSFQSPTHLSLITLLQPFRMKCVTHIFLKNRVRSSLLLILFLHVYVYSCIRITAMQHNLQTLQSFKLYALRNNVWTIKENSYSK